LTTETQTLAPAARETLIRAQRNEITEYYIYHSLARTSSDPHNREILASIANDEKAHYDHWRGYSQIDVEPARWRIRWYVLIARILGLTFGIKLMERGEERAQDVYGSSVDQFPDAESIIEDEDRHEHELIALIDEERLRYVGSIVLGLNDALVELTGMLAGLTLAFQNTRLIGTTGLITGVAASLSMAASEFLSRRSEQSDQDPIKASVYTGVAYVVTVLLLILPYLIVGNFIVALVWTLFNALLIILFFSYYVSVAQDISFKSRASEMTLISFGVAAVSFVIGYIVREVFGVDV